MCWGLFEVCESVVVFETESFDCLVECWGHHNSFFCRCPIKHIAQPMWPILSVHALVRHSPRHLHDPCQIANRHIDLDRIAVVQVGQHLQQQMCLVTVCRIGIVDRVIQVPTVTRVDNYRHAPIACVTQVVTHSHRHSPRLGLFAFCGTRVNRPQWIDVNKEPTTPKHVPIVSETALGLADQNFVRPPIEDFRP